MPHKDPMGGRATCSSIRIGVHQTAPDRSGQSFIGHPLIRSLMHSFIMRVQLRCA